ncbi:XP_034954535.1uncharacterized protein LOC118076098 [Podarcis lilfordi]|uniref:XP_034954535.1uncharacterized protein LOC118076098 n=1 Tax=Podarcis lilfordi TaxID=74358 RepID=A0AA35VQS7_9SAUR|nr:XP_034954535.1uncharacterized protein LOC118076098 [Podarcis lilfordi]
MAPKKAAKRPAATRTSKRPIKGPSQALRSGAPRQAEDSLGSLVTRMAGDPAALTRLAAEVDGLIRRCSMQSSAPGGPASTVGPSSPASSSSSEDGGEAVVAGVSVRASQPSQPPVLPVAQVGSRGPRRTTRRSAGRQALMASPSWVVSPTQSTADALSGPSHSRRVSSQSVPGTSQQTVDLESSDEDSLPTPARTSSGGHRCRRKRAKKRAKRRKVDTSSSSSSGTSSSSDDETEASLDLYWGFGEEAGGFPKWIWERRANSHRARYGAVQDCRDGVLVPEVKVSTNSVRDIIPGAHLSTKLRARILNGRYVDIFKLAPPPASPDSQEKDDSSKKRAGSKKLEKTFERWLDGFQVFAGIVVMAYPRRAHHLMVYLSIVRSAFTMAGQLAAIAYDVNFRRRAAKISSARWDRKDLDVWTTYVVPHIEKKALEQQKPKAGPFRPTRKLTCWDFNKGSCQRQFCKFSHVCDKCTGGHPASTCLGSRRPFRGGKGGSQQPPKAATPASTSGTGK